MLVGQGRAARAEPRDREAAARRGSSRSRARLGARIQVVEVPPGPPVLQTLVAEVYGPDRAPAPRAGAHGALDVRADAGRRRRRLVRRVAAAEVAARRGRREGGGGRAVARREIAAVVQHGRRRRCRPGCCTIRRRARTCRSCCGCRASCADRSTRVRGIRLGGRESGRRRRADAGGRVGRGAERLPQEPAAGDLRDRRRRRRRSRARSTPSCR